MPPTESLEVSEPISRIRRNLLLGSVAVFICLCIGIAIYWFHLQRNTFQAIESEKIQGALFLQSHSQEGNSRTYSLVLVDGKTGGIRKLPERSLSDISAFLPYAVIDSGIPYIQTSRQTVSGYDFTVDEFYGISLQGENVTSFAVKGGTLVYLVSDAPTELHGVSYSSCSLRMRSLGSEADVEILTIPVCSQAHGPNYTLHEITADGQYVTLFERYGEAGYESVTRHEVNLITKADVVEETVSSSPVCDEEGVFYDSTSCTSEIREENAAFETFQKTYGLGRVQTMCGALGISQREGEYYTFDLSVGGVNSSIQEAVYVGCIE